MELLIHNFAYVCSALISLFLGFFILLKDIRKKSYILLFVLAVSYSLYCFFYLLSVNILDPEVSGIFAFLMIVAASSPCLNAHLAFVTFGIEKEHKNGIRIMYASLIALWTFLALDPDRVRLLSAPRGYLPNFFVPGPWYWLYMFFFFFFIGYFFTVLILHYKKVGKEERNRLKYFFLGFGWGYTFSLPIFINILDIANVDMMWTVPTGLYTIPLAYGVYKYDLLKINIAIKNTLLYGGLTIVIGVCIIAVNILNNKLIATYADFPTWPLPFLSSLIVVLLGFIVGNQLRQAELLKYEFINNISHKFRTPLTHIRWLAEELRDTNDQSERDKAVDQIQFSSMRLYELTNIVIGTSQEMNNVAMYRFVDIPIQELLQDIDLNHRDQTKSKKMKIQINVVPEVSIIKADRTRLQFALQILYENALVYTPENGTITITVEKIGNEVVISFKDTGIGIAFVDLPNLFAKFYRSPMARHIDTEGLGVGLYMAKDIVEKHGGHIRAESEGEGKGATFSIALPLHRADDARV